jgi:hypothetical protein
LRIFEVKSFARFARRERIDAAMLREAVDRLAHGLVDADLGSGLFKQRIARPGEGRSGGYRVLLAYRRGSRCVFLYGFAKSERANIGDGELASLRLIGTRLLEAGPATIQHALDAGALIEVDDDEES